MHIVRLLGTMDGDDASHVYFKTTAACVIWAASALACVETACVTLAGVDFMLFPTAYAMYALGYMLLLGLEVLALRLDAHIRSASPLVKSVAPSSQPSMFVTMMLFGVLSFHAFLEGVGVSREPAWITLHGILAHKTMSLLVISMETHHHYSDDK
ncbi:hypothetical protein DYB32_008037 [Aphanomyces invadans]|uniref:Uncharacterized protein n=1 Tax=Aphanomyces invadans TaxID=157072 RepID=A0A3R6ZKS5_9STRA|nr:hypothetical protein DYB32_008037 [Aphanomyces invadans]